jgi:hypothetical protein
MRQFGGEIDLETHNLRLLVPSKEFLNKLPEEMEQRLRRDYAPKPNQSFGLDRFYGDAEDWRGFRRPLIELD